MATINQIIDDEGLFQGQLSDRERSDDRNPTLNGNGEPGEIVRIYDSGTLIAEVTANKKGAWSYETDRLSDGKHSFTVTSLDSAGVELPHSSSQAVVIDKSVSKAVGVGIFADNSGGQIEVGSGDSTHDDSLNIAGMAERGATVEVFDKGVSIGTVAVDGSGQWSMDVTLDVGKHKLTTQVTDSAGNVSGMSSVTKFNVDMMKQAPDVAPTVDELTTTDTGALITGTASLSVGDELSVEVDGVTYTTANGLNIDTGNASWSLDLADDSLTVGEHDVVATVSNNAGSISDTSNNEITIEAEAVVQVVAGKSNVGAAAAAAGAVVLPPNTVIFDGGLTNDSTPLIRGRATPGSEMRLSANGEDYGPITVDSSGTWSVQVVNALPEGETLFSASATNAAGTAYFGYTLTIDTVPPETPVITSAEDNVGAIQVDLNDNDHTDDDVPELFGTGTEGDTIRIFDNNQFIGTVTVDSNGEWNYLHTSSFSEGAHRFTAIALDEAGNTSRTSNNFDLTVDRTAETATITHLEDDVGKNKGDVLNGKTTDDELPLVVGEGQAGATVEVFNGSKSLGSAVVNKKGDWELDVSSKLTAGNYTFTTVQTDLAGNVSERSAGFDFKVQLNKNPNAKNDSYEIDRATNLNVLKNDVDPDGNALTITKIVKQPGNGSVKINKNGTITFTPDSDTQSGVETFTYQVKDGKGGFDTAKVRVEVHPKLIEPTIDLVASSDSGRSDTDNITNISTPELTGTAAAGSTVVVYDGSQKLGETTADGSGNWSITSSWMADAVHNLTVKSSAFGQSITSSPLAVTIDTVLNASITGSAWSYTISASEEIDYGIQDVGFIWGSRPWINQGTSITSYGNTSSDMAVVLAVSALGFSHGYFTLGATLTDVAGNSSYDEFGQVYLDPIASLKDGGYVVTYLKLSDDADLGFDVFAQRYDALGNTTNDAFLVNSYQQADQVNSDITGLEDGGFLITWQSYEQDGSDYGIYAQRYDVDGSRIGGEVRVNDYTDSAQEKPEITSLDSGGYVITWMSEGQDGSEAGVYVRVYDADGNVSTDEILVNSSVNLDQANPTVTTLDNGSFVVSWQSNHQVENGYDIYAKIYSADGVVLKSDFLLNSVTDSEQATPNITNLSNGGFATSWVTTDATGIASIAVRTFDQNGKPILTQDLAITEGNLTVGSKPEVSGLDDGSFVLVWASDDGQTSAIYSSRYDQDGTAIFEEKEISSSYISVQTEPHVVALEDGGYLVSWTDVSPETGEASVYAKQFDQNSESINGNFEVGAVVGFDDSTFDNDIPEDAADVSVVPVDTDLQNLVDDAIEIDLSNAAEIAGGIEGSLADLVIPGDLEMLSLVDLLDGVEIGDLESLIRSNLQLVDTASLNFIAEKVEVEFSAGIADYSTEINDLIQNIDLNQDTYLYM